MSLEILAGLVFLVASGAIGGLFVVWTRRFEIRARRAVEQRLRDVQLAAAPAEPADGSALVRAERPGALPAVERLVARSATGSRLGGWLRQSGLRLSLSGLLLLAMGCGLAGAMAGVTAGLAPYVAVLAFAAPAAIPFGVVAWRRSARLRRFEELFPEALDLISRAVQAGHAFAAGLKMVADEMRDPVGPEFRATFDEQNFGLPMAESLHHLSKRVPLVDVRFFVTAVLIQRETGGNLAEILDNLANVVRERFTLQRQVRTHTAHGRFTGYILIGLPAFLALALSFIQPDHMNLLFQDPIGQRLIVAAITMQAIGWLWIRKVIHIEV